ncbi:MAG: phytase [Chlamydiae bacterium]|nr:phytase [Chlamydiota bacterium]
MKKVRLNFLFLCFCLLLFGCAKKEVENKPEPKVATSSVTGDADDCAIWIHPKNRNLSVIIGNDKTKNGALFGWDLKGKELFKIPLKEPMNIDIRHSAGFYNEKWDIVACPLQGQNRIKVFKMDPRTRKPIDITTEMGILTGFDRDPYGFALYHQKSTGKLYAFVSQMKSKSAINQILLEEDGMGKIKGTFIRSFGQESIQNIVEGMCADDDLGYIYLADEKYAILKFFADPKKEATLIHSFAHEDGIIGDREGVALYTCEGEKGYLLLSSQGNSTLKVYERGGMNNFVKTIEKRGSSDTDGLAATSCAIPPEFPFGFVVCHNDKKKNFVIYSWEEIAGKELQKCFCHERK